MIHVCFSYRSSYSFSLGFFDLQVNGYFGADFNSDDLDGETLESACARLSRQGVDGILATIITDTVPAMERRLRKIAKLRAESTVIRDVIHGIHIEGPFLNATPGFRGAHPATAITTASEESAGRLLEAAGGLARIMTLAPETDPGMRTVRSLVKAGVIVSAGHTNASVEQLKASIDAGLTMFTHLGNGCPATLPRHDNIIQRVLSLRHALWLCFIADGAHIPFFALKNYLDLATLDRTIVVTDAIVAADCGPGTYTFGPWTLSIGEDLVPWSDDRSHLVGSTVTMQRSHSNLVHHLNLTPEQARQVLEFNPKKAVGILK
jgi:N-acetylglucosamine-6-phosphate deacetylase